MFVSSHLELLMSWWLIIGSTIILKPRCQSPGSQNWQPIGLCTASTFSFALSNLYRPDMHPLPCLKRRPISFTNKKSCFPAMDSPCCAVTRGVAPLVFGGSCFLKAPWAGLCSQCCARLAAGQPVAYSGQERHPDFFPIKTGNDSSCCVGWASRIFP